MQSSYQNNYAGLGNQAVDYTNEESSPDMTDTNNFSPSPNHGPYVDNTDGRGEDDFSSL